MNAMVEDKGENEYLACTKLRTFCAPPRKLCFDLDFNRASVLEFPVFPDEGSLVVHFFALAVKLDVNLGSRKELRGAYSKVGKSGTSFLTAPV